jgi:hypothetical protein
MSKPWAALPAGSLLVILPMLLRAGQTLFLAFAEPTLVIFFWAFHGNQVFC